MKKYILIILFLSVLLIFSACSDSGNNNLPTTDTHLDIFTGKVIEIKDDNTILLKITEERGGYEVDDKVYVHYDEIEVLNTFSENDADVNIDPNYIPVIGDVFSVQAIPDSTSRLGEYDYRESNGAITKYVYIDASSDNS